MKPNQIVRFLRRVVFMVALIGVGYLALRYEGFQLDERRCSGLLRFSPGDALLVDRFPRDLDRGQVIVFYGPAGLRHLALIQRVRQGAASDEYWVGGDVLDCPTVGSEQMSWLVPEQVHGRVIMVWPW